MLLSLVSIELYCAELSVQIQYGWYRQVSTESVRYLYRLAGGVPARRSAYADSPSH